MTSHAFAALEGVGVDDLLFCRQSHLVGLKDLRRRISRPHLISKILLFSLV